MGASAPTVSFIRAAIVGVEAPPQLSFRNGRKVTDLCTPRQAAGTTFTERFKQRLVQNERLLHPNKKNEPAVQNSTNGECSKLVGRSRLATGPRDEPNSDHSIERAAQHSHASIGKATLCPARMEAVNLAALHHQELEPVLPVASTRPSVQSARPLSKKFEPLTVFASFSINEFGTAPSADCSFTMPINSARTPTIPGPMSANTTDSPGFTVPNALKRCDPGNRLLSSKLHPVMSIGDSPTFVNSINSSARSNPVDRIAALIHPLGNPDLRGCSSR